MHAHKTEKELSVSTDVLSQSHQGHILLSHKQSVYSKSLLLSLLCLNWQTCQLGKSCDIGVLLNQTVVMSLSLSQPSSPASYFWGVVQVI